MNGMVAPFAGAEEQQPQSHQYAGNELRGRGSDGEQHAGRPYEVPPLLQIPVAPDLHRTPFKCARRTLVQYRHNGLNARRFLGTRDGKIGLAGPAVHPTVCVETEFEVVA